MLKQRTNSQSVSIRTLLFIYFFNTAHIGYVKQQDAKYRTKGTTYNNLQQRIQQLNILS